LVQGQGKSRAIGSETTIVTKLASGMLSRGHSTDRCYISYIYSSMLLNQPSSLDILA
jgi:hypothetical protein